jgi:hypothetical protein
MRKKATWGLLVGLVLLVGLAGCATFSNAPARTATGNVVVTPLERAKMQSLLMMDRYTKQLRDAESLEALVIAKKASVEQVRIYRLKRMMLIEVRPLISAFDDLIDRGEIPSAGREQEIFNLLNRLAAAAG